MKTWLNKLMLVGFASIALWSCKKDEVRAVSNGGSPNNLTSSASALVLASDSANGGVNTAVTFDWTETKYGFKAAVKYTLELALAGTDFADARKVEMNNALSKSYSVADFNTLAILLGISPNNAADVEVRVLSTVTDAQPAIISNVTTLTVTPYLVVINYPKAYVPGGYQGWNPGTADAIASVKSNGVYEGYINFGSASEFKITSDPDWSHTNYGLGSAPGTLSTSGGNLSVADAGYYKINADFNGLTYSATKTDWGLIGSATPGGWGSDQNLTYDDVADTWTITVALVAGEIKFRANDDWGVNFGDNKPGDGIPEYGGDNIPIAEAGTYKVTLNLGIAGNYSYSVKKQ